jgi:tetratricopeptide (TPR) repeat protein
VNGYRSILAILLLTIAGLAGQAAAQPEPDTKDARDEEARGLFLAGRAAYDDGRYEEALNYFRRSYELSDRPELLYNIGQTASVLNRDEEALWAFEKYLERYENAPNYREVEDRIMRLRRAQQAPAATEAETGGEAGEEEPDEAEARKGEEGMGLDCGAHVLLSYIDADRPALGPGLGAQGRFGLTFTPQIMAELSAAVSLSPATETDEDVLNIAVRGGGRYLFTQLRPLVPFLGVGLSVHRWSASRIDTNDGSTYGVSDVNWSLDLMGGARFDIVGSWAAEAILQIASIFKHDVFYDYGATGFTLALGFVYYI